MFEKREKVLEAKGLMIRITKFYPYFPKVFIGLNTRDGGGTNTVSSVAIEGDGKEQKISEPLLDM